ncbi:SDR family NAD(P)-dependent oxidoreductase [Streptomyces sp. NPDC088801]|uniref:SDR family NAD(P)-dependent oxidoreductase n=1 Tax=Streptomyces sp. NPDC088801 TaxID=3365903 RepID=UPI00380068AC
MQRSLPRHDSCPGPFTQSSPTALPLLLEQGRGAIVNTSSLSAHVGDHQRAAYQTSKAGIDALTRHVASRWGSRRRHGSGRRRR